MVGGLGVRITLTYESDGVNGSRIEAAAGRVFGSAATFAPLSHVLSLLPGATWEEAGRIATADDIMQAIAEGEPERLPQSVWRAADFVAKALRRALGIAQHGTPADCTGPGILVCRCIGVGDRAIRDAIRGGATDPEAIGDACGACTGCRSCRSDLLALIDEETRADAPGARDDRHPVERITLVQGGRVLRGLGLGLADARVTRDKVRIGFSSRKDWAMVTPVGAVALVRHVLRETVHDDIRVEPQNGSAS